MTQPTQEQIIIALTAIEPNLMQLAQDLTNADVALVEPLLANSDERVRANAYTLISLIAPAAFNSVAVRGASDRSPLVRMQVAVSANNLTDNELINATEALELLLRDSDHGVRKFALRSGSRSRSVSIQKLIQSIAESDAEEYLRGHATDLLRARR